MSEVGLQTACPLCGAVERAAVRSRKRHLYRCGGCRLVYADRSDHLGQEELKNRYLLHENGIANSGYCEFLNHILQAARPFVPPGARGLDYGCGPVPTLSALAAREGIAVADYDPIFLNRPPTGLYDIVFSTECFEHFEEPAAEIAKVTALIREGGILAIMTELWDDGTNFDRWYYASDPTHVAFYARETVDYFSKRFGLRMVAGDGKRVFVFRKSGSAEFLAKTASEKEKDDGRESIPSI